MFQDALLESSPAMRRRNAWPMATAFTLQIALGSLLVLLPLISTGVLPVATRLILPVPPRYTPMESQPLPTTGGSRSGIAMPVHQVVQVSNMNSLLSSPFSKANLTDNTDLSADPQFSAIGTGSGPNISMAGTPIPPSPPQRVVVSRSLEAMLVNKVMPVYPAIAKIAGVQGDVQLHAIIAKDGAIQSLTVTSGPEMLRDAALRAVQQWRYRPYMLNGVAVEVETVITVSFHKL